MALLPPPDAPAPAADLALLSWNVTWRCNLRCPHCYLDATARAGPGELSTEEGEALIDDVASLSPGAMLVLSGGEPLLRRDLPRLAARGARRGLTVVVGTNGTLLDDARAEELAGAGVTGVGLSLDSLDPARHDAFRGVPGAAARTRGALAAARRVGLAVQLQTTVLRENYDEIPALVEWAARQGVRAMALFFLVCTGRGQRMTDLSPERYEDLLRWVATAGARQDILVRARCAPHFRPVALELDPRSAFLAEDASACLAGRHYARVAPNGDVTPCPYLPLVVGNVRAHPFSELWRTAPAFASLRAPSLGGRCGDCEFASLCGGCRARAFAASGDLLAEDPWCARRPGAKPRAAPPPLRWDPEAEGRLANMPAFIRGMVRRRIEARASERGLARVTIELVRESRERMPGVAGHPPHGGATTG